MSNTLPEYPLYQDGKDLNRNHLTTLDNTIQDMLDDHTRVFALRVDLHINVLSHSTHLNALTPV